MKKLIALALFSSLFFSCEKEVANQFEITGKAIQFEEEQTIFLEALNDVQSTTIDTAIVNNGVFHFTGQQTKPELHFIRIEGYNNKIPVIIEEGQIALSINKDSINNHVVSGTYNNNELQDFKHGAISQTKLELKAYERLNNAKMIEANQNQDAATMQELEKGYQVLLDKLANQNNNYINTHPNSYISILLLEDLLYNPTSDIQKIQNQYNNLSNNVKNSKKGKFIGQAFEKMARIDVGNKAPDFSAPTPKGDIVSLKATQSKLILIDFWASWCGPCRSEFPYLIKSYQDFNDKGLEIISVSLDKNHNSWVNSIIKNNLDWIHVSNLKHWDEPIAKKYKVQSIPATFLIDEKGIIIAKDLHQEDMYNKIEEILILKKE